MRKTTFAGLTVVGPTESILSDNGAFMGRDRDEIDRLGQIGAVLHRHNGLPGLTTPPIAPSGVVLASGGTIDSGLTISLGYTLVDSVGGETTISPLTSVSTPIALDPPEVAPSAGVDYSAGSLDVDTYYYGISYIDGEGGETPLGDVTEVDREAGFPNGQLFLTDLDDGMLDAGAVGWKLYRARGGGDFVLLTTGTGSDFTDDGSVSPDCDTHPPTDDINTTYKTSRLQVTLPSGSAFDGATFINLYGSLTGTFAEGSLLRQYPVASAGATDIFTSLEFFDSQPPDVNRSYGGANRIDPDTELIDNHWKRPVASASQLPTGSAAEEGDVRIVRAERTPYTFEDGDWAPWGTDPPRAWGSATINLASGASGMVPFTASAAGIRLIKLSTNLRARVRVYGDQPARTADAGRAIGTDPTGDHGVLLDYANTSQAGGGTRRISPAIDAHNLEEPPNNIHYLSVTNYEGAGNVVVAFLYIPTEVV